MKIIGIVGETASGKSLVAQVLKNKGAIVFDADNVVHYIYNTNLHVISWIARNISNVISDNKIDRKILLKYLFCNKYFLYKLEAVIHPIVIQELIKFLKYNLRNKTKYVVLDIPLLFKIKANYLCDVLIYVNAKTQIREKRILSRHKNDLQIFSLFPLKNNDNLKKNCDFIINSGMEKVNIVYNVVKLLEKISNLQSNKISVNSYSSMFTSQRV